MGRKGWGGGKVFALIAKTDSSLSPVLLKGSIDSFIHSTDTFEHHFVSGTILNYRDI